MPDFFYGHQGTQDQHPPEIPNPNSEHQQHQRPATPDTEEAVMHPQPESLGAFMAPAPVLGDETQRRAALVKASILQRRELIQSGQHPDARANNPGVRLQPGTLLYGRVQEAVTEMDDQAKHRPHAEIPRE